MKKLVDIYEVASKKREFGTLTDLQYEKRLKIVKFKMTSFLDDPLVGTLSLTRSYISRQLQGYIRQSSKQ
jgi:hypothetical protein